jgi:hypothetical protein
MGKSGSPFFGVRLAFFARQAENVLTLPFRRVGVLVGERVFTRSCMRTGSGLRRRPLFAEENRTVALRTTPTSSRSEIIIHDNQKWVL